MTYVRKVQSIAVVQKPKQLVHMGSVGQKLYRGGSSWTGSCKMSQFIKEIVGFYSPMAEDHA